MNFIALALLALGSILLPFTLRGRVIERGVFCRKCRFDLAGLDLEQPEVICPECGGELSSENATRPVLRRKRRVLLAGVLMLLLAGLMLMSVSVTNKTARVLAVLPNRVVLALHGLGMDAAYTEIATNRLTLPKPLSDDTWAELIRDALDHQADVRVVWDPRDGEVLLQAFTTARLTPDQIEQYFDNGLEIFADFSDEIRHGVGEIGVTLLVKPSGRISSLSGSSGSLSDGIGEVWNRLGITGGGLIDPHFETPMHSAGFTPVRIPSTTGGGHGSIGEDIPLSGLDWDAVNAGETRSFFIRYDLRVQRISDDYTHFQVDGTIDQPVRILPRDAQPVALDTDLGVIARFQDRPVLRLSPLRIVPREEQDLLRGGPRSMRLGVIADNLPIAVVGRAVVIQGGHEFDIGEISLTTLGSYLITSIDRTGTNGIDDSTLQQWLDAGRVTIEVRPDPRLAEQSPGIDRILGVPIRFEQVQVTEKEISDTYSSAPNPKHTPGRPVTEPTSEPASGVGGKEGSEP